MVKTLFPLLFVLLCTAAAAQKRDSVVLRTESGKIYGTITTPLKKTAGPLPIVIIIPGSGPTDRDGNSGIMANNGLKLLSDSLAKYGIASLRFDKRGIAASKASANEASLMFSDYAEDVAGWVNMLKRNKRFNRIFIAGHSEGALVGMLAAKKAPVSGFISLEGPGKPADAAILDQLAAMPHITPAMLDTTRQLFRQLREEGHLHDVPSAGFYQSMFRSSVQRYLHSWIQFDPARELKSLDMPVLIIQGTSDLQVDTAQAHLLAAARPDARLLIVPGMNHIFRTAPADNPGVNMATFYDATLPIRTEIVQGIVRFINRSNQK